MELLFGILKSILEVARLTWWFFLPILLFFPLRNIWLIYVKDSYIKGMEWALYEIKVPKDITKTPKAMEQVFAAMYADFTHGIPFLYRYIDGLVDTWYSFEIVGYAGGINFYVLAPTKRRNVIESAIYSQYPDAEIHEVEDYTSTLPRVLPNRGYDLWGTDLILKRESFYPIRTYPYFEENVEERRLDPISAIAEVMAGLKGEERLWWQVVLSPTSNDEGILNDWKEQGMKKIDEIMGKKTAQPKGFFGSVVEFLRNLFWAPVEHPAWEGEKKETAQAFKFLNPAETEVVKAIDGKVSKLGFETRIRFIYIDRRENFSSANATAVMGTIRQFNTQNLNNIGPGQELTLVTGGKARFLPFYQKLKLFSKKKKVFSNYKVRKLNGKMMGKYRASGAKLVTFNTEELATVYHFPLGMVEAPTLRKLGTRKGGPPAELPVEL